ncbi:MAG: S41 family peptidase [Rheinheimera sp.]|nr:S41 family peptidase [Rheinheimera sp.]
MSTRTEYLQPDDKISRPLRPALRAMALCCTLALTLMPAGAVYSATAADNQQQPIAAVQTAAIDVVALEQQIRNLMQRELFNPALLASAVSQAHLQKQQQLAAETPDVAVFIEQFNQLWRDGPWSHMQLAPRRIPAAQMAAFVDNMTVGPDAVQLRWDGTVPVLSVNTMMGKDTMQAIAAAFTQLQQAGAQQLIIDLRRNKGGAFAVKPLVQHLLQQPMEAGVFLSRQWYLQQESRLPNPAEIAATPVWQHTELQSFWPALSTQPLVRIRFTPELPTFTGQVWLLTSHKTASAAEMAVAALQQAGRVTVIGEQTAGEMLSQRMFDLPGDLQLSLPIAGYITSQEQPIEGVGLKPDIQLPAHQARQHALSLAQRAIPPANRQTTSGR